VSGSTVRIADGTFVYKRLKDVDFLSLVVEEGVLIFFIAIGFPNQFDLRIDDQILVVFAKDIDPSLLA
jgi:hypothetical protein